MDLRAQRLMRFLRKSHMDPISLNLSPTSELPNWKD